MSCHGLDQAACALKAQAAHGRPKRCSARLPPPGQDLVLGTIDRLGAPPIAMLPQSTGRCDIYHESSIPTALSEGAVLL
jgi:hypothetical protein